MLSNSSSPNNDSLSRHPSHSSFGDEQVGCMKVVKVVPRRKAGEPRITRREKKQALALTKQLLSKYYGCTVQEVASMLGIGVTALKTSCRKLGIRRWPTPAAVPTARVDESQLEVAVESADSSEVEVESADALLAEVTSGYLAVQPLQDQQAQASAIDRQLANSPGVFGKPDDQPRNPLQMIMMEVAEDFEQLRDTPWRFDVGAMIKDDASQSESAQSQQ